MLDLRRVDRVATVVLFLGSLSLFAFGIGLQRASADDCNVKCVASRCFKFAGFAQCIYHTPLACCECRVPPSEQGNTDVCQEDVGTTGRKQGDCSIACDEPSESGNCDPFMMEPVTDEDFIADCPAEGFGS
jgi:hypothetical protein